jgi:hypothetical protein
MTTAKRTYLMLAFAALIALAGSAVTLASGPASAAGDVAELTPLGVNEPQRLRQLAPVP